MKSEFKEKNGKKNWVIARTEQQVFHRVLKGKKRIREQKDIYLEQSVLCFHDL